MSCSKVSFRYKDYRDGGSTKLLCLDAVEFIRRFVQHCLPLGFQKIRYYGILGTRNRKDKLAKLQHSLGFAPCSADVITPEEEKPNELCCPACGKPALCSIIIPAAISTKHWPPQVAGGANSNAQRAPPLRAPDFHSF